MENPSSNRGRHIALRPIQRVWDSAHPGTIQGKLKIGGAAVTASDMILLQGSLRQRDVKLPNR